MCFVSLHLNSLYLELSEIDEDILKKSIADLSKKFNFFKQSEFRKKSIAISPLNHIRSDSKIWLFDHG